MTGKWEEIKREFLDTPEKLARHKKLVEELKSRLDKYRLENPEEDISDDS